MGYNYTTQDSGGYSGGYHQLKIFVYPDDSNDEDVCQNQVIPALINACEQAYNSSSVIDYWEVSYCDDYPNLWDSDSTDKDTVLDNWYDELESQSSIPTGSHLLIDNNRQGGVADGGDIVCDGGPVEDRRASWFDWSPAIYGTEGLFVGASLIRNVAIQEAFHNFIDQCIPEVEDLAPQEHALGQIYSEPYNPPISPMLTTYEDEYDGEGDCLSGVNWGGTYTETLTDCTKTALDETAKEHGS